MVTSKGADVKERGVLTLSVVVKVSDGEAYPVSSEVFTETYTLMYL